MKLYVVQNSSSANDWREKVKDKAQKCWNFVVDNKEIILILMPIAASAVGGVTKLVHKSCVLKKEEQVKNLYCYDRSLGHFWALRRELSNSEWLEIDARKKNGERLGDILSELKVLK